jgi:hypothetical protein
MGNLLDERLDRSTANDEMGALIEHAIESATQALPTRTYRRRQGHRL